MRIFVYIWKYKYLTILITLLLLLQAFISFLIPYYTSKIIDTGIQQKGIEKPLALSLKKQTYDTLQKIEDNSYLIKLSYDYDSNQDVYQINDYGLANQDSLTEFLKFPLAFIYDISYEDKNKENYDNFKNNYDNPDLLYQKSIEAATIEMSESGTDINKIETDFLIYNGSIMLILSLIYTIILFSAAFLISLVSLKIGKEKRSMLMNKIMQFSLQDINKFSEGSLIIRSTNNIQNIQDLCEILLRVILYAPICIIVGFYFAFKTAIQLSWIIVLAALGIIFAAILFRKFIIKYFRKTQVLLDKVSIFIREMLSGIYVIRAFNKENYEEDKFNQLNTNLFKYQLITGQVTSLIPPLMTLACNFMSIFIILIGQFLVNIGQIQVGGIIAFINYSAIVVDAFAQLGRFIGKLPQASVAVSRVEEILEYQPIQNKIDKNAPKIWTDKKDQIIFKNVSFNYESSKDYVLKDISFSIEKGTTLGIIGTVGSGKTSLLNLLLRLYEPSSGDIFMNDNNISQYNIQDYRKLFAYVPQQSFLFSGSIKSNVSYAIDDNDSISDEELYKYIQMAQANDFVNNRNKSLDKKISQDSINISGGQKQRLSIARALASKREILIIDDSLSALDYKTEKAFLDNINNNKSINTKIIVSSRLSSIINADKIIVLQDGKIAGSGPHKELIKNCEEYKKIAKSQLDKLDEAKTDKD